MANWDLNWIPFQVMAFSESWNTKISTFESGKEQRRKKWNRSRFRFELTFDVLTGIYTDEIRAFFEDMYGRYTVFDFANYAQRIKGTRVELNTAAGVHTIADTTDSGYFVKKGYGTNFKITVSGSGAGNNGIHDNVSIVAAALVTFSDTPFSANETGNDNLAVYPTYNVRFSEDTIRNTFLKPTLGNIDRITLIVVI